MRPRRAVVAALCVLWCAAIGVGLFAMHAYAATPGASAAAPARWPADSAIPRLPGRATVALFALPDCPCTRASLSELAAIADTDAAAAITVVYAGHDGGGATQVHGARTLVDRDGREAARFGAQTSGFVVVYGPEGTLRFAGGITSARGHAGDNVGRRAVLDALAARPGEPTHAVFGCALATTEPATR